MATTAGDDNMSPAPREPAPATTPDIFFTLPPELRDMVYKLLHGDRRRVKIKWLRKKWEEDEDKRRWRERENFKSKGGFPTSDVSHLLVSKQYFEESCRIWIGSKTLCFSEYETFRDLMHTEDPISHFLLARVKALDIKTSLPLPLYKRLLARAPLLHSVSVQIESLTLQHAVPGKIPWLDSYTDIELATIKQLAGPLYIRGLRDVRVTWAESFFDLSERQHHHKWAQFRAQVETLIRDVVTQPRESRTVKSNILTIGDALKTRQTSKRIIDRMSLPSGPTPVAPLSDKDIPQTESEMLRLFLARPAALTKWIRQAAEERIELLDFCSTLDQRGTL